MSVIQDANHLQIVTYCDVAVAVLVIYEYLLSFKHEVDFVWFRKWTPMKVLYLVQRYIIFVDSIILILYSDFTHGLSDGRCQVIYTTAGYMYVVSIASSEVILSLRVLAVWGKPRKLVVGIPIFFVVIFASLFAVQGIFLQSMTYSAPPAPFYGCYVSGGSSILFLAWTLLMVYDAVMMVLIIIPGITLYRQGSGGGLFNVVYRDGVIYYIFLFVLALGNVICIVTLPLDLASLMSSPERAMHTILTTRFVHNIRATVEKAYSPDHSLDIRHETSGQFVVVRSPE